VNRTERLLDLITYLLNAKEPVSWRKIKNHFPEDYARGVEESNQRKFERDKAELISLGIPIDYQGGSEVQKEGYLIQKDNLFLPELEFRPEEFSLLMLSAEAVRENESFPYRDQLESALHKIISLQKQIHPAPQELTISYSQGNKRNLQSSFIHKIQDALDRRKSIKIKYHAFSTRERTDRDVDPYGLIFRKGKWTMVAWDHLREDIRTFVVTRIEELEVNQKKPGTPDYQIPEHFSLQTYQNQQPWELQIHPSVEVTLQISEHRVNELMPQLSKAANLGQGTFRLQVTNQSGLISWLLSQKTDVQVLEPAELNHRICEVLQALL
jgi:proteasome accessory factor B